MRRNLHTGEPADLGVGSEERVHLGTLENLGQGMDVGAVHMYFNKFVPDTKKGLISRPCSLFEDVVHDAILDPAWAGDDDNPERGRSVGYQSQECGVYRIVKSGQPLLVGGRRG